MTGSTDGSPRCCASTPSIDGHNDLLWAAREKVGYDFDRLELNESEVCRPGPHTDLPAPAGRGSRRAVLVGVRARDAGRRRGGHGDPGADRRRPRDDRAVRRPAGPRPPRSRTSSAAWQSGRIASLMGAEGGHQINESLGTLRMLHRLGRALPDPDPQRQRPVGRLGHRRAGPRRALRLRSRGRRRDEPDRDAGRPQPRERRRDAPGAGRLQRAGRVLALLGPRALRPPAQRARRRARPGWPATAACAW